MRAVAAEDNFYVGDDIAFEVRITAIILYNCEFQETIVPRFIHYCRAHTNYASNGER